MQPEFAGSLFLTTQDQMYKVGIITRMSVSLIQPLI